jgi:hypothetical protein
MPAFLCVYVNDSDATFRRAIEAGARSIEEPFNTPYGDRRCMGEDEWAIPGKSPRASKVAAKRRCGLPRNRSGGTSRRKATYGPLQSFVVHVGCVSVRERARRAEYISGV